MENMLNMYVQMNKQRSRVKVKHCLHEEHFKIRKFNKYKYVTIQLLVK